MSEVVFVYGSLRKGKHNHGLLSSSKPLGMHKVRGFSMFSLGAFPCIVPKQDDEVVVEAYDVDEATMQRLDWLEGYPSFYNRTIVSADNTDLTGWVYYMENSPLNAPYVEGGDWVK